MALTNSELKEMVRAGLGRGDARTDLDEIVVQSLNLAFEEISRRADWVELVQEPADVTLVVDQGYINLSDIITAGSHQSYDNVHKLLSLNVISGSTYYQTVGLSDRRWAKLVPNHPNTDTTGRPRVYNKRGNKIYLYPVPDSTYVLRIVYSLYPTPIQHTSGSITSGTNPGQASAYTQLKNLDSIITAYAIYWSAFLTGNTNISNRFFGAFEFQLKEAMRNNSSKIDNYVAYSGYGTVNEQVLAPSDNAQAGIAPWDASYRSRPF